MQFLGDDLLDETLGVGLVVDRELLRPGEAFGILELVDVVPEHSREQRVKRADPEFLGDFPVDTGSELALFDRRQGAPGLAVLTLGELLRQQELQSLLHFPRRLVGESHSEDLGRIRTVLADQMGDAMGERTRFPTASSGHHQQRPLVVIHCPALGVVEAGQKAHGGRLVVL